jgi:hypothetical protein
VLEFVGSQPQTETIKTMASTNLATFFSILARSKA